MANPENIMSPVPTIDDRLAEAEANEAKVEEQRTEAGKVRRLKVLDLKAKYRAEVGAENKDFAVLEFESLDKVIVLKRPELVVVKAFDRATAKTEPSHEQLLTYVMPSVLYPTTSEWRALVDLHPKVAQECGAVLRELEGVRVKERSGK